MTRQPEIHRSERPVLLDLFCGAGGCAKGYQRAGFYVVGVDTKHQPNYCGDEFHQADALEYLRAEVIATRGLGVEAVHASPPCPHYSLVSGFQGVRDNHPDMYAPVKRELQASGLPYVIENVPGSPLRRDLVLCGEMFGLRVHRHRVFELGGFFAFQPQHQRHVLRGAATNCERGPGVARWITGNYADHRDASDAMGIDWMARGPELANAIPPAYTEYVGAALLTALGYDARAAA